MAMKWILASASPRRRELLAELICDFEIIPAKGEEKTLDSVSPEALVQALAKQKAEEVAALPQARGKAVIGSDTVVAYEGEVLGKPKDEADAFRMLKMLSGKTHEVFTGVCIAYPSDGKRRCVVRADRTAVYFEELSDEWIRNYIKSGSPMDKAGAYGIQDGGLVKKIEGSYSNVVGFPLELVGNMLTELEEE